MSSASKYSCSKGDIEDLKLLKSSIPGIGQFSGAYQVFQKRGSSSGNSLCQHSRIVLKTIHKLTAHRTVQVLNRLVQYSIKARSIPSLQCRIIEPTSDGLKSRECSLSKNLFSSLNVTNQLVPKVEIFLIHTDDVILSWKGLELVGKPGSPHFLGLPPRRFVPYGLEYFLLKHGRIRCLSMVRG